MDVLRSALSKAKQAAQERPLKTQLAHTDAFIERSRLRIQELDQEREAEMELLNSALQRQARLREQIAAEPSVVTHPAPSDSGDELVRLRAKVAQLEASLSTSHPVRGSAGAAEAVRTRAAKRRVGCDDDTIPNDAQDFDEWIGTKMLELRDANDVGDLESVIHLTSLISQGASRMKTKAWHPGPPRRRISRPVEGRDVIPRMHFHGSTQVDEDSDVAATQVLHRPRRVGRRVSSDSDVPLVRGSRFAVLTERTLLPRIWEFLPFLSVLQSASLI